MRDPYSQSLVLRLDGTPAPATRPSEADVARYAAVIDAGLEKGTSRDPGEGMTAYARAFERAVLAKQPEPLEQPRPIIGPVNAFQAHDPQIEPRPYAQWPIKFLGV